MARPKPVVLLIFDGWGVAPPSRSNALSMASIPFFTSLTKNYQTFTLQAAGEAVGLPFGEKGNSEVGHLNLGAGKIMYQDLPRINKSLSDGSFFSNHTLIEACTRVNTNASTLHIIAIVSNGAVHGSLDHLMAMLELAHTQGVPSLLVHVILDGRDTPFNSGKGFVSQVETKLSELGVGRIASVSGRFYAMDRDNHWERIAKAYSAIAEGVSDVHYSSSAEAIDASYANKVYDEEFVPTLIIPQGGTPHAITSKDAVVFLNYRADRAREITHAFIDPVIDTFPRARYIEDLFFVTMAEYESKLHVKVAFPPELVEYPLARIISEANLTQLHVAETEKYAHVTYFFNGGNENAYTGETRVIIPSKSVASYASAPEMSAHEVRGEVVKALHSSTYDFIVANFANPDMVAHTGDMNATRIGLELCDTLLKEITELTLSMGGVMCMTADHGNCEEMLNLDTGEIDKEHSDLPVPFIIAGENYKITPPKQDMELSSAPASGVLADVAPTILAIMELPKPSDMTGMSLV